MDDTADQGVGLVAWNGVLSAALAIPGARIDREVFLRSALGPQVSSEALDLAIATTPAKARIPKSVLRRAAESSISWHRGAVSLASAGLGMPGGWWIAGTIPTDLAQYFWHVVVVLQKLAYLNGWPALLPEQGGIDDETRLVLTLFIGVVLGAHEAAVGLNTLASALSREVVKRLPRAPLTKYAVYRVAKEVAKWIGIKLTKKKFAEFVGRAIPLFGGVVAAGLSWSTFGAGANRLLDHLEGLPLASRLAPE